MSFSPTNRAFRFSHGQYDYAVDIQLDGTVFAETALHLFRRGPSTTGWFRVHAPMEPMMPINKATVDAAGGIEPMCRKIIEKANKAMRTLLGFVNLPPGAKIEEQLLDYLRANVTIVPDADGVPQLRIN